MQQVTVGQKYQIVIPKEVRSHLPGVRPGAKVWITQTEDDSIKVKPVQKNWVEQTRGLAKKAWRGIDATKYLEQMRNDWSAKK